MIEIVVCDVVLVYLLLTSNRFHRLFWCFYCWLWTRKCRLAWSLNLLEFWVNYNVQDHSANSCKIMSQIIQFLFSKILWFATNMARKHTSWWNRFKAFHFVFYFYHIITFTNNIYIYLSQRCVWHCLFSNPKIRLLSWRTNLRITQQYIFTFNFQQFEEGSHPPKSLIWLHKMCL